MSAIIFCSSLSAKSTISFFSSTLDGSSFFDFFAQLDPPAFAGPGDLLGLLAEVVQVEGPADREPLLQGVEGLPETRQVVQVLVDSPGHRLRRQPGREVEGDVEGGHELVRLEQGLLQQLEEGLLAG